MADTLRVSIVGGSGYTGGELLRLLLFHPKVEVGQTSSLELAGKKISSAHPNLRKASELSFCKTEEIKDCDLLFSCLPHGVAMGSMERFLELAPKVIDLSADFRLRSPEEYARWYRHAHACPKLAREAVYGIPELHRKEMKEARIIGSAGCSATATILPLYPLLKNELVEKRIFVDGKIGSSASGTSSSPSTHHPERSHVVRSYAPTGHRHTAEMIQELSFGGEAEIHFTPHAVEMVRGISITSQAMLKEGLEEIDVWKAYRKEYREEPFIRIVKEKTGNFRYPEPKILIGSNYCDIGFEKDPGSRRLVVMSAIDNLMKGAAGQAVQCMNAAHGWDERTGLQFTGFHPI